LTKKNVRQTTYVSPTMNKAATPEQNYSLACPIFITWQKYVRIRFWPRTWHLYRG